MERPALPIASIDSSPTIRAYILSPQKRKKFISKGQVLCPFNRSRVARPHSYF